MPTPFQMSSLPGGSSSYSGLRSGDTARFLKPQVLQGAVPAFVKAACKLQQPYVHATKEAKKRALKDAPGFKVAELSADSDKLQSLVLWIDRMAWAIAGANDISDAKVVFDVLNEVSSALNNWVTLRAY